MNLKIPDFTHFMVNYIIRINANDTLPRLLLYNERVSTQLKQFISQEGGLALDISQTPTHPPTHSQILSPPGQQESRKKVRRLTDWVDNGLTEKTKVPPARKTKKVINLLFPIGQQISSLFLGSRVPAHTIVTWQDKCHNFPFLFFLPVFISGQNDMECGISLWSVGICCLPVIFCPIPAFFVGVSKRRENLAAVQALFSNIQTNPRQSTSHRLLWWQLTASQAEAKGNYNLSEWLDSKYIVKTN